MNPMQVLTILRARKWIFLLTLGLTVATAIIVSLILPKSYTATTTLVVNFKGTDPVTGAAIPAMLMPGYLKTQTEIVSSRRVARNVVEKLNLASSPVVRKQFEDDTQGQGDVNDWLADRLLQSLEVEPSRESSVISISYRGADPRFAAALANAFAASYAETNLRLKVEPSQQAAAWFNDQIKGLRENLEKAQAKLSAYQREHGIIAVDERLDVETARLADLSSQVVMAQSQTFDSLSRQRQLGQGGAAESPDIMANPLIQGLKSQLVQAEAKFTEVSQRMQKNHPQYQAAANEVANLKARIDEEVAKAGSSIGQAAKISQRREGDLRAALSAQKSKLLELKQQRDDIAVLTREVENAQRVYDLAMQRFSQTSMEGQANQTDVAVLNVAVPPLKPSSPRVFLNAVLSLFLGTLLGLGFALLVEMVDRRIRTADDVSVIAGLPVLGSLNGKTDGAKPRIFNLFGFRGGNPLAATGS
ncbi:MAG TPA: chain length determinant protein EpsF [Methylophilaceae bacterium]|jgi:succinoglycan biosynthesis transport protein ExoP|nr:chain length determinant protein EpsF [Methylophilaceae bacterium]